MTRFDKFKPAKIFFAVIVLLFPWKTGAGQKSEDLQYIKPPEVFYLYRNFPSKYIPPRHIEIWVPPGGENSALPVLYMFDGQNMFHGVRSFGNAYINGWQVNDVLDSLITAGTITPAIIVAIYNKGEERFAEYMPQKPYDLVEKRIAETTDLWYSGFKDSPPRSDAQLKFIVEELKPFIDKNFHTLRSRKSTWIAGSSMGGLMAAYAICEYPDIFGAAACLSTHWPALGGVFIEYLKNNLPDPHSHKIYFDYGTEGLDAEYEPYQKKVDAEMQKAGYEMNKNWITVKSEGAKHHDDDWHDRLHIPLEFLLSRKNK
ncbi:MAG: alpha/beta hydrolase-fold protein [Prolixibacteraceae bacterium]